MIQNVLRALGGIDQYGVASLLLFGLIFIGVVIYTCAQKKSHLERMAHVPLENDSENSVKG